MDSLSIVHTLVNVSPREDSCDPSLKKYRKRTGQTEDSSPRTATKLPPSHPPIGPTARPNTGGGVARVSLGERKGMSEAESAQ